MKHPTHCFSVFTLALACFWLSGQVSTHAAPAFVGSPLRPREYRAHIIDHDPLSITAISGTTGRTHRVRRFVVVRRQNNVVLLRGGGRNRLFTGTQVTVRVDFTPDPSDPASYDIQLQPLSLQERPGADTFRLRGKKRGVSVEHTPQVVFGGSGIALFTVDLANGLFDDPDTSQGENKQKVYFIAYKATSPSDPTPLDQQFCVATITFIKQGDTVTPQRHHHYSRKSHR